MAVDTNQLEVSYNLPPGLLDAVSHYESTDNPDAINEDTATGKPSIGKFQFQPATAEAYGIDPTDEDQSTVGAAKMFADLHKQYKGDIDKMLAAYNWGSGNLAKHGLENAPKETKKYISNIKGMLAKNNSDQQTADNEQPQQIDKEQESDKQQELLLLARARLRLKQQQPDNKQQDNPDEGLLAKIGKSTPGQVVGSGIDAAQDVLGNLYGMASGNKYQEVSPHPDLDTLGKSGFHDTPWPKIAGAGEEALFDSPTGQLLRLLGATPGGAAVGTGLSEANKQAEEQLGLPHQYSTAIEMAAPFLAHNVARGAPDAINSWKNELASMKEDLNNPPPPPGGGSPPPPPGGGGSPPPPPGGGGPPNDLPPNDPNPTNSNFTTGAGGEPLLVSPKNIKQSTKILTQILRDEGINPEEVADKLQAAQKDHPELPLTALDVATKTIPTAEGDIVTSGKQLMAAAKSFSNMPGQGASMAGEVAARGLNANKRIANAFDNALSNSNFYDVKNDAIAQMKASKSLYDPAYKANLTMDSPEIKAILNTPAGRKALANAVTTMQNSRSAIGVRDPDLVEQAALAGQDIPPGGIMNGLKMRTLDLVKQELWDLAESQKNPDTLRDTSQSRAIKGQMKDLTNELDKLDSTNKVNRLTKEVEPGSGLYSQARKAYSNPARVEQALVQGRQFTRMDPEQIKEFFSDEDTSQAEKNAFAAGARRAIQDRMGNAGLNSNYASRLWKENMIERLKPMFENEDDFNKFSQKIEHELTMARTNGNYNAGSPTAPNLEYKTLLENAGTAAKALVNPAGAAKDVALNILSKRAQKAMKNSSKETAAGFIRYLTTKDPELWRELAKQMPKK